MKASIAGAQVWKPIEKEPEKTPVQKDRVGSRETATGTQV
jgi:hypothetical protein